MKLLLILLFVFPTIAYSQHMGVSSFEVKKMPELPQEETSILEFIDQFPASKELTVKQKEWFYWTNYSRSNPRRFWDSVIAPLVNTFPSLNNSYSISLKKDLYKAPALPLVRPNANLRRVASKFADELAAKKAAPSHTSPSGSTFPDRMKDASIKRCAGENISFGPDNPAFMLVLLYIDEGVPELGHRKTLLNPEFVEMGIGVSEYPDNKLMVIQDFACTQQ